jgi:hypothetical protein
MNPKDIAKFVESLSEEQRAQFEVVFKTVGESMEVEVKQEEKKREPPVKTVNEDFSVSTNSNDVKRRIQVRGKKNQWVDNEDLMRDVETPEGKRTPRDRKKQTKTDVECHVCGRDFKIDANLVFGEYHRCNRCGGK